MEQLIYLFTHILMMLVVIIIGLTNLFDWQTGSKVSPELPDTRGTTRP